MPRNDDQACRVYPQEDNLEEARVDTSKEQEATNESLTRSENDCDNAEGEVHPEFTLNSAQRGKKRKTPYWMSYPRQL